MTSALGKITAIKQDRKKSHCIIFIDGKKSLNISIDTALKFNLHQGMEIDKALEQIISREQLSLEVKQKAYSFASYKPRTVFQLKQKLKLLNYSDDYIEIALGFLEKYNLLDDERYARTFAKEYITRKACGINKLVLEMLKRGINKDTAIKSAEEALSEYDLYELALKAADKQAAQSKHKDKEKKLQSMKNYLFRMGFDWDVIKKVLDSYQ